MSLFADKLEGLARRIKSDPDEFSRLVHKHRLENYSGSQFVLFAHPFNQEKAIVLGQNQPVLGAFRIVFSNQNGCFDCDNHFVDELPKAA